MKKTDITKIFESATDEQITAVLNLHNSEMTQVQNDLDTANQKLTGFEGVDVNDLNDKITDYQNQIQTLQNQLAEEKAASAVKFALMEAKALDTDYLSYKLTEKMKADGKTLELDENGKIKDWDNLLQSMQTQFPTQFESGSGAKKVEEHKLPEVDKDAEPEPATLADALHDFYESDH